MNQLASNVVAVAGEVGKSTTLHLIQAVLDPERSDRRTSWSDQFTRLDHRAQRAPFRLVEIESGGDATWHDQVAEWRPKILVLVSPLSDATGGDMSSDHPAGTIGRIIQTLDELSADSVAVLLGDDPTLQRVAECTAARVVTVGRGTHCDLIASDVQCRDGWLTCQVDRQPLAAPLWGRHQIGSMLAAFAVGRLLNQPPGLLAARLNIARPLSTRCEVIRTEHCVVIDDTSNSRPATVGPALELLRDVDAPGRRIVVCGELSGGMSAESDTLKQIGEAVVARCGADWLVAWGPQAQELTHAARDAGLPADRVVCCEDADEGQFQLASLVRAGDVVLVKGQGAQAMRKLVQQIVAWAPTVP